MAGLIDFLVFDLLTGDEEKERARTKRRSVIFEGPVGGEELKSAPIGKRKAGSAPVPAKTKKEKKRS